MSEQPTEGPRIIHVRLPWQAVIERPTEEELAGRSLEEWAQTVAAPAITAAAFEQFHERLVDAATAEVVAGAERLLAEAEEV